MQSAKQIFLFIFFTGTITSLWGQVIPPGMGKINSVGWFAVGINQDLNPLKSNWQSISYLGIGRTSNPDNNNPLYRPGILILNQEFKNKFHKNWEYILAASYRRQNEYSRSPPYEQSNPDLKQEFRLYGRLSYIIKAGRGAITPAFRQEVQKYYTPDFKHFPESLRLRSRFRLKFELPLSQKKEHRLLLYSEQLFSTSYMNDSGQWTPFEYKDSRFSIYYSLSPKTIPFSFNVGYMNNLIETHSTHYLGVDIVWKNPFTIKK